MKLAPHFTYAEFVFSQTAIRHGIANTPDEQALKNLHHTAAQMEKVRELLGAPIFISSGYRSPELNAAIGGSKTSQHMSGEAADFVSPFGSPLEICRALVDAGAHRDIVFDQLIYEGTWVHISFLRQPRGEILTWKPGEGYSQGIVA